MTDVSGTGKGAAERTAESTRAQPVYIPQADIYETKDALFVSLEMPGANPDAISITLDKRVLAVRGRSVQKRPAGFSPVHAEYREGDYERSFTLSEAIDGDRIEASFKDGILDLKLPKAQPAPAKKIGVKHG